MSETISIDTPISRRSDVLATDMSGDTVMFSMDRGMYYGMKTVASFIWNQLEQQTTAAAVAKNVIEKFEGAETEQVQEDVLSFVNDLSKEELIHVHDAQAA